MAFVFSLLPVENIWWAISPLATMFSILFNNKAIFYGDFSGFCLYVFKVVCCRFVLCWKGYDSNLKSSTDMTWCLCTRHCGHFCLFFHSMKYNHFNYNTKLSYKEIFLQRISVICCRFVVHVINTKETEVQLKLQTVSEKGEYFCKIACLSYKTWSVSISFL